MKRIAFFIIALAISLSINAQDYQKMWKEYDENIANLLPESAEKVLNKIDEILFYIVLSPLILIALLVKGVAFLYRKIFKKPKPQNNEEKALFSLMTEHLNCEPQ